MRKGIILAITAALLMGCTPSYQKKDISFVKQARREAKQIWDESELYEYRDALIPGQTWINAVDLVLKRDSTYIEEFKHYRDAQFYIYSEATGYLDNWIKETTKGTTR